MKNNTIITINDTTAQVSKAFEKQARTFGTPEFALWMEYKKYFPNAQMVTKSIKKKENKKSYKNLTYKNMETYLSVQDNGAVLIREYRKIKAEASTKQNPYRVVLKWFLEKYDEERFNILFPKKEDTAEAPAPAAEEKPQETSTGIAA